MGLGARRAVKRAVRVLSSTGVRALGLDVTDTFTGRATLVVAPHPDDETLGCGATIARMRARGTPVEVAFVSSGGSSPRPAGMSLDDLLELRRAEAMSALEILGVEASAVAFLDFEDGAMPGRHQDMVKALAALLEVKAPEQVLVTSASDRHPDHAAVARAVRAAASGLSSRHDGSVAVYEYPIWQRVPVLTVARDAARSHGRPRTVRTGRFLALKDRAIAAYESQLPHFPVGFVEDFLLPVETFTQVEVSRA